MNAYNYTPIEKHSHPWYISALSALTLILAFYSIITFIWIELPFHRTLKSQMATAEKCLNDLNTEEAFYLYQKILTNFPKYKTAQLKMAKTCFLLAGPSDEYMYELGLCYLDNITLNKQEIKNLTIALAQEFKTDFKSKLKVVKR